MHITHGYDASTKGERVPVIWNSRSAVNGHKLIVGMSGSGKTYTLRRMIQEIIDTSSAGAVPRIYIYDVHGDIEVPGASTVKFSEQTMYGLNPLRVSPDPHHGGVRKAIQTFMATINKVMRSLGPKQEAALRNILYDIYELNGFKVDDPSTWAVDENRDRVDTGDGKLFIDVPYGEREEAKVLGARFDGVMKSWWIAPELYVAGITKWPPSKPVRSQPSIKDALIMARHILLQRFMGTNQPGVVALEAANAQAKAYQRKLIMALRRGEKSFQDEAMIAELEKAKDKAVTAYTSYAEALMTGRELSDVMRYDSTDVLKSVVDRLENLDAIGIFKAVPPPFDPNVPVHRYDLSALSMEERKMFIFFDLKEKFMTALARGEQNDIRNIFIIDEAHLMTDDDPDNIVNTYAKESRKFGSALWLASQSPTHFSEDFIASVATKIVLGIDEMYWRGAALKMRCSEEALAWVRMQKNMLVQIKAKGSTKTEWKWTLF